MISLTSTSPASNERGSSVSKWSQRRDVNALRRWRPWLDRLRSDATSLVTGLERSMLPQFLAQTVQRRSDHFNHCFATVDQSASYVPAD
jgi:hypothetical protein